MQFAQNYHCFSCKAGGNVITFVQEYEKITGMEAVERLAQRAGINLGQYSRRPDLSSEIAKLFDINQKAARYFYDNLVNDAIDSMAVYGDVEWFMSEEKYAK